MRLNPKLATRVRINLQNSRPGAAQVLNQPSFFQLAGFKKAQESARMLGAGDPAEIKPEGALTFLADQRRAKMGTKGAQHDG